MSPMLGQRSPLDKAERRRTCPYVVAGAILLFGLGISVGIYVAADSGPDDIPWEFEVPVLRRGNPGRRDPMVSRNRSPEFLHKIAEMRSLNPRI